MAAVKSTRGWDALFEGEFLRTLERDALPAFLKKQRWFAGKARSIARVRLLDRSLPGELTETARLTILEVSYDSGAAQTYFLPIGFATGPAADKLTREAAGRVICPVDAPSGKGVLYDALADPNVGAVLLEAIGGERTLKAGSGLVRGIKTSAFAQARGAIKQALPAVGGSFEQSNSAVIFGDRLILKVFRRLEPGINPDFEIGRFLSEKTKFDRMPRTAGALTYDRKGAEPLMLGILQGLVPNQGSGWDHALESLKTYYQAADENSSTLDYGKDAALLGQRTAEMHLALASDPNLPAFRPEPITPEDLEDLALEIRGQVEKGIKALEASLERLPEATARRARAVIEGTPGLMAKVEALSSMTIGSTKIRVHGDYHLGQVLRSNDDFVILDFEGEPAKSLAERVAKITPLKDVVGMIRSFDYAAFAALFAFAGDQPEVFDRLVPRAIAWRTSASDAFLDAYKTTAAGASFLPEDPAVMTGLLDALILDKALYELAYELNNRPDWVRIPLQGIAALIENQSEPIVETQMGELDLYLLNEGTHYRAYDVLGAHPETLQGVSGVRFAVWAPNAREVSIIGEFNGWKAGVNPTARQGNSGYWEGFVPGLKPGTSYKYAIASHFGHYEVEKADPYAFAAEPRPQTASVVADLTEHAWQDATWLANRMATQSRGAPLSIYEVHLGSWMRHHDGSWLTYRELGPLLADYVHEMGFTHVELMPVAEHPFDGSWGYQVTGYFAPTSRFGSPADFMAMVDLLHQREIGVILDWVPAHFPTDGHALGYFDGTHLYEHPDPRQGFHPDWDTFIFNFGRPEVANFLITNALFWIDKYHIDGLRVDAVASMLYRDYSRKPGEWIPNQFGGRENLEAITMLKRVNEQVHLAFPDVLTIAEESTSWPMVTRPTFEGGLGFDYKWDMGWMHDTLDYFAKDPVHRKHHHNRLTFRGLYAYTEAFVLPLSHDEVVYGKHSLLGKMPGDRWQQFANVRLLFGYMFAQPGKKMMFMGDEFGPWNEWNHDAQLEWGLLDDPAHSGLRRWVRDLNTLYRGEPAVHELDTDPAGFRWIDANDSEQSVLSLIRQGHSSSDSILFVANFTPIPRINYRVGVPRGGHWTEILNSDATIYGGSGQGNIGGVSSVPVPAHGHDQSIVLTLPPLALIALRSPNL